MYGSILSVNSIMLPRDKILDGDHYMNLSEFNDAWINANSWERFKKYWTSIEDNFYEFIKGITNPKYMSSI